MSVLMRDKNVLNECLIFKARFLNARFCCDRLQEKTAADYCDGKPS